MVVGTSIVYEMPLWLLLLVPAVTHLLPLMALTSGFRVGNPLRWTKGNFRAAALLGVVGSSLSWLLTSFPLLIPALFAWTLVFLTTFIWDWLGRQGHQPEDAGTC